MSGSHDRGEDLACAAGETIAHLLREVVTGEGFEQIPVVLRQREDRFEEPAGRIADSERFGCDRFEIVEDEVHDGVDEGSSASRRKHGRRQGGGSARRSP